MKSLSFITIFIIFPIIELYLLIKIGAEIGALITVIWVVASIPLGIYLIKYKGLKILSQARENLLSSEPSNTSPLEGVVVFIGGILLILPGFISDILGLLLMISFIRQPLADHLLKQATKAQKGQGNFYGEWVIRTTKSNNLIIEGEAYEKPQETNKRLDD